MRSLWLIVKKNLKLLLRSKGSALIIIFAPLLIILLLGLSYNTSNTYGLNIGITAPTITEEVNSFVSLLEAEGFQIIIYENDLENCIEDIKSGTIHTCIDLPESLKIEENTQKEVTFHVDPSRINLVWMIQETVKETFNLKSQQISQELTQQLLERITTTKEVVTKNIGDISTIKDKTATAVTSINKVKGDLVDIDTSMQRTSNYDSDILTSLTETIDTAQRKIDDADELVELSILENEEKAAIRDELKDADEELESIRTSLTGNSSESLGTVLNAIQSDLESAQEKLTATTTAIGLSNGNLGGVVSSLNEINGVLTALSTSLSEALSILEGQQITEAGTIVTPLTIRIEKVGEEGTYLNYIFSGLLVMVIMFSSLLLGTSLVMMSKSSPAFFRNYFLPVRRITFIAGTYFTNVIIILVEIAVILGISLFFQKEALSSLPTIALILFVSASVFTLMGMALGYAFTSEETSILASFSLGTLLLFFSGIILPLEGLSHLIRSITYFSPFVLTEKLIREVFLFGTSLTAIWQELLILVGYAIGLFLIIVFLEWLMHKHFIHRMFRHYHKKHRHKEKQEKKDV